jgi:hypothetical protein
VGSLEVVAAAGRSQSALQRAEALAVEVRRRWVVGSAVEGWTEEAEMEVAGRALQRPWQRAWLTRQGRWARQWALRQALWRAKR